MNLEDVRNYLIKKYNYVNPKLKFISRGESNDCYALIDENKKQIIRINRSDRNFNKLKKEFLMLEFLENQGIANTPKPIKYDSKNNFSISSYIDGKNTPLKKFTKKQIIQLSKIVANIYFLQPKAYKKKLKENKISENPNITPLGRLEKHGYLKFKLLKKHLKDKEIISFIESELEAIKKLAPTKYSSMGFIHADLDNNLIINKNIISIIDWECGKFTSGTDIGHTFNRSSWNKNKKLIYLKTFCETSKLNLETISKEIEFDTRSSKIHDIIWTLNRFFELKKLDNNNFNKYWKRSEKLIKEYKKQYLS